MGETEELISGLQNSVPNDVNVKLPKQTKKKNSIATLNREISERLVGILSESEHTRLKQQIPVLIVASVIAGLQLLAFNGIMFLLTQQLQVSNSESIISMLLDFLKYYIGAVVVELIGMLYFITKSTFTSHSKDIIDKLFIQVKSEILSDPELPDN